jgi:phosphoglucomutase/phosphomannomutase
MSSSSSISTAISTLEAAQEKGLMTASALGNVKRWLSEDYFAPYQPQILDLVKAENFKRIDELFWEVIPFGTGGRRGPMADIGSATMNPRTIAESAYGMAVYLRKVRGVPGGRIVITCDTRNRSQEFAEIAACVCAAQNMEVFIFEKSRSTPELSFAVRHLNCDIGIMISASHNPPADNGFKAYWSNGGQVLPPHDKGIIDCVYQAQEIPLANYAEAVANQQIKVLDQKIDAEYIKAVSDLSLSKERGIKAIYTPLHGVGETNCYDVAMKVGFKDVEILELQRKPDGNFTNVADHFPNPERPQVFEPAIEQAKKTGAELILASDPDADRLGVVVKSKTGDFVHLTGNQIGALVLDYILQKRSANGTLSPQHFVIETLVTTPLIASLGKRYNLKVFDNLLVGFKYIGQTVDKEGPDKFVFGAEESLGFLAGQYARDKDAAVATLYILEHASELKLQGKTLLDRLDELYAEHGYYMEGQISESCSGSQGKAQINALMEAFRKTPPRELAGIKLVRVDDYGVQEVRGLPSNQAENKLDGPKGDLVIFHSAEGPIRIRTAVRPSGTEPKIKFYFFADAACKSASELPEVKKSTTAALDQFKQALKGWILNELTKFTG